jgi:hypothetical protein
MKLYHYGCQTEVFGQSIILKPLLCNQMYSCMQFSPGLHWTRVNKWLEIGRTSVLLMIVLVMLGNCFGGIGYDR